LHHCGFNWDFLEISLLLKQFGESTQKEAFGAFKIEIDLRDDSWSRGITSDFQILFKPSILPFL